MSVALQCPQCQAPISANTKKCEYCQSEIFVNSVAYLSTKDSGVISRYLSSYQTLLNENPRNLEANVGVGVCFLIRGLYQEAQPYFVMATKNLFRIFLKLMLQKLRSPYVSLYSSVARNFSTAYDTFLTN